MAVTKISDIPLKVRRRIISELCEIPTPIPPPSRGTILSSWKDFTQKLPLELLSPALSGYPLSAAVADALGSRAAYLTTEAAGNHLHRWIEALAPHVRGLILDSMRISYMPALLASALEHVSLSVLHVNFWNHRNLCNTNTIAIERAFVLSLQRNASSLRELSLSVHRICIRPLKEVALSNLQVIQFTIAHNEEVVDTIYQRKLFKRLMLAVGAASSRQRGESRIREMRLVNFVGPPFNNESWYRLTRRHAYMKPFFQGIKTLHVVVQERREAYHYMYNDQLRSELSGDIFSFMELLSELRCLTWENGAGRENFSSESVQQIIDSCPNIEEIHLLNLSVSNGRCSSGRGCSSADGYHNSRECVMRCLAHSAKGKLRTFCTKQDFIDPFADFVCNGYQSELEEFQTELHLSEIDSLTDILENCRKLRILGLKFRAEYEISDDADPKGFGAIGWERIATAVRSASNAMTDLYIGTGEFSAPAGEKNIEATIGALVDILTWMGKRARKVHFVLNLATLCGIRVVTSLCMLLDVAACNNHNLEEFEVRLSRWALPSCRWTSLDEKEEMLAKLALAGEHLKRSAPRLHRMFVEL